MKKFSALTVLMLVLSTLKGWAQKIAIEKEDYANSQVEMADVMRSEGKIYVLLAIILIIFIGFIFYQFSTERKLKKLEKEHKIVE